MARRRKIWRKQYLINPKAQFRIVFVLGFLCVIGSVLTMFIVYQQVSLLLPQSGYEKIQALNILIARLAIVAGIMTTYFLIAGVVLTNRVVGPIFRLQMELRKFFEGHEIGPIKFRGDDDFQEILPMINKLINMVDKKVK